MGKLRENYEDKHKEKLEQGLQFQDFVSELLYKEGFPVVSYVSSLYQRKRGENIIGVEIKFDSRFREGGSLYIETAEKPHPMRQSCYPSGIYRKGNIWLYAIGDYSMVYLFPKKYLQLIRKRYKEITMATSKGFLLLKADADKYAIRIFTHHRHRRSYNECQ
jgi:hypothetical protein